MECPNCGEKSKVVDSRKVELNVFRVRECKTCGLRFYTEETEIDTDEAKIYGSYKKVIKKFDEK